jgi:hypothetical protein
MQLKIFRFLTHRRTALFALFLGVLSAIAHIVSASAVVLICQDVLYSSGYSECSDQYEVLFRYVPIILAVLAVVPSSLYLFRNVQSRKKLQYPFFGYVVFLLVIILPLSTQEFCLGFLGCSSLAPFALTLGLVVLIALVITSVLVDLFLKSRNRIKIVVTFLAVISLLTIGLYYTLSAAENLKDFVYNHELEDTARRNDDVKVCHQTLLHRLKDRCISSYAIGKADISYCEDVISPDIKEGCVAFVIRNKAIGTLDTSLCNEIAIPSQVSVCKSRIQENLRSKR